MYSVLCFVLISYLPPLIGMGVHGDRGPKVIFLVICPVLGTMWALSKYLLNQICVSWSSVCGVEGDPSLGDSVGGTGVAERC